MGEDRRTEEEQEERLRSYADHLTQFTPSRPEESADETRARATEWARSNLALFDKMPVPLESRMLNLLIQQGDVILGKGEEWRTELPETAPNEAVVLEDMILQLFQMRERALCGFLPQGHQFSKLQEQLMDPVSTLTRRTLDAGQRRTLVLRLQKIMRVGPAPKDRFAWEVWRAAILCNAEAYGLLNDSEPRNLSLCGMARRELPVVDGDLSKLAELAALRFVERNSYLSPRIENVGTRKLAKILRGVCVDGVGRGLPFAAATLATECQLFGYDEEKFDTAQDAFRKCLRTHPDGRPWAQVEEKEQAEAIENLSKMDPKTVKRLCLRSESFRKAERGEQMRAKPTERYKALQRASVYFYEWDECE